MYQIIIVVAANTTRAAEEKYKFSTALVYYMDTKLNYYHMLTWLPGPFRPLYQCAAQEHKRNHDPRLPITKACLDRAPSQRRPRYSDEKKRPRASDRLACSVPLRVCARPGTLERHGVPGEAHCGGQPESSSQQWPLWSPSGDGGGCSKRGLRRPAPNGSSARDRDGGSRAQLR